MDREYTSDKVVGHLMERLASRRDRLFRRRAVLTNGNNQWELVCCTVEEFPPGGKIPQAAGSRHYAQMVLHEAILTQQECLRFATELQLGHARFDDIHLPKTGPLQWTGERVPANNEYMARAGYVVSVRFGRNEGRAPVAALLSVDHPYYPDVDEAARDWLPFAEYHGYSDGRNEHILFLLPETRAFIEDAVFSGKGTLDIKIAGTEAGTIPLLVKGAFWEGKAIRHFQAFVQDSKAELIVPSDADRIEYYLIDPAGTFYDFHREDRFTRGTRKRARSIQHVLEAQVRHACESGEGFKIEFKPFVDPLDKHSRREESTKRLENTKLRQILETVAAFANSQGGHIYLGINDDCTISGVGEGLRAWAQGALDESSITRYLGELKSKIKDFMDGEVTLQLFSVEIDGMVVIIIDVAASTHGPVALRDDYHLYVRRGASNRKARPDQWMPILSRKDS